MSTDSNRLPNDTFYKCGSPKCKRRFPDSSAHSCTDKNCDYEGLPIALFQVSCPHCFKEMLARVSMLGKQMRCMDPGCKKSFEVTYANTELPDDVPSPAGRANAIENTSNRRRSTSDLDLLAKRPSDLSFLEGPSSGVIVGACLSIVIGLIAFVLVRWFG